MTWKRLKDTFLRLPILAKMLCFLIPVIFLFMMTNILLYGEARTKLKDTMITSGRHNFDLIATEWNAAMQGVQNDAKSLSSSENTKSFLSVGTYSATFQRSKDSLSNELFNAVICSECLQNAILIRDRENYIARSPYSFYSGKSIVEAVYRAAPRRSGFFEIETPEERFLCCVQPLTGHSANEGRTSYLVFTISPKYVKQLLNRYAETGVEYYIVAENGEALYSSVSSGEWHADQFPSLKTDRAFLETNDWLILSKPLSKSPLTLVAAISKEYLLSGLESMQRKVVSVNLIASLAMLLLFARIFRSFARRIQRLNATMETVSDGDYTARCPLVQGDEIGKLGQHLNKMLDDLQSLVIDSSLKEVALKHAQLDTIKNQSSPHFLFNTLETIRMIAYNNGDREVPDIIKQLSRMLRYSIDDAELVVVDDEIQQIERYLKIQRLRFGDRFSALISVEPDVQDRVILKLLLQPLVENAFKHGIEPCPRKAELTILGRLQGDGLLFVIADTGVGMRPEVLGRIQRYIQTGEEPQGVLGIGLKNTIDRLKLYFPGQATIEIDSERDKGTEIRLAFPIIALEDDQKQCSRLYW